MISRIFPLIVFLIAIGIFFTYTYPTYNDKVRVIQAELRGAENALAAADRFKQKEAELVARFEQISDTDKERLSIFLPDGVDNVQLILDINALATRTGVEIGGFETIEIGKEEEGAPTVVSSSGAGTQGTLTPFESFSSERIGTLEITLQAEGTYSSFRAFLFGLEQSLRIMDITNLSVTATETGVYSYDITIHTYWLK